ncbi:hypothetical protein CWS02_04995 [Enterobacter sp. EA-1]|nr:hypothetical protein CWS02_04995 [Enterobacter sp. EA-1]
MPAERRKAVGKGFGIAAAQLRANLQRLGPPALFAIAIKRSAAGDGDILRPRLAKIKASLARAG